jgi:hypothetical protein
MPSHDWIVKVLPADMDIAVSALPTSMGKSVDIHLALSLGPDGKAAGCGPAATPPQPTMLADVACKQLAARSWSPLKDQFGNAVASIQQVLVRFSATN